MSLKKFVIVQRDPLEELLSPFQQQQYLPHSIISDIIHFTFESSVILHNYSEIHKIVKVKVKDFMNAPIVNWMYNRPPDMTRCPDIAKSIYHSRKPVDTMFYISFNHLKKVFEILDGVHRYTALKIIYQENCQTIDLLTPGDFGSNRDASWLFEEYIILNLHFNSTVGELIDIFKNLNKTNPVPDIYIRDTEKEKKEIIEKVCNHWQSNYKSHFSCSMKPNRPNVNRDRFIDLLDRIYDKYNITEDSKSLLFTVLEQANQNIMHNLPRKIPFSVVEKCMDTGCYLFIHPMEKLEKLI